MSLTTSRKFRRRDAVLRSPWPFLMDLLRLHIGTETSGPSGQKPGQSRSISWPVGGHMRLCSDLIAQSRRGSCQGSDRAGEPDNERLRPVLSRTNKTRGSLQQATTSSSATLEPATECARSRIRVHCRRDQRTVTKGLSRVLWDERFELTLRTRRTGCRRGAGRP